MELGLFARAEYCPKCDGVTRHWSGKRWVCNLCRARYARAYRPHYRPTLEQKRKMRARSYANVYKRRNILIQHFCEHCGSADSQMHHPDYSRPLLVEWLCRPCHLALHREAPQKDIAAAA